MVFAAQTAPEPLRDSSVPDVLSWMIGRQRRYRVVGESMAPTLQEGDTVLVNPSAFRQRRPTVGELVVLRHPLRKTGTLIKRVSGFDEAGRILVTGDNPACSTDSRSFGAVPTERMLGLVVSRMP